MSSAPTPAAAPAAAVAVPVAVARRLTTGELAELHAVEQQLRAAWSRAREKWLTDRVFDGTEIDRERDNYGRLTWSFMPCNSDDWKQVRDVVWVVRMLASLAEQLAGYFATSYGYECASYVRRIVEIDEWCSDPEREALMLSLDPNRALQADAIDLMREHVFVGGCDICHHTKSYEWAQQYLKQSNEERDQERVRNEELVRVHDAQRARACVSSSVV